MAQAIEAVADVIVAQGTEAGGHGQSEPLITLLPQVVDACPDTPVAAAGGIADGRGLAAAIMPRPRSGEDAVDAAAVSLFGAEDGVAQLLFDGSGDETTDDLPWPKLYTEMSNTA